MDYYQTMINAVFTGIGTATGLTLFELFAKDKVHKLKEKIQHYKNHIKDIKVKINSDSNKPMIIEPIDYKK